MSEFPRLYDPGDDELEEEVSPLLLPFEVIAAPAPAIFTINLF